MGLDQYLYRMKRFEDINANQVSALESYLRYCEDIENPKSSASQYSFKEWTGFDISDLPDQKAIFYYRQFYNLKYSSWDKEHKYGHNCIMENIGDWRKANHIHNWFVENVQDGKDDCNFHNEVTKEKLEELLNTCKEVLENSKLIDKRIENPSVAQKLLPTVSGFFFGGTEYDDWYIDDIKNTIDIITKALKTTDFDTEMIYYVSSW